MNPILLTFDGMRQLLVMLVDQFGNDLKIGLFLNPEPPQPWWTLDNIIPATFPGYPGLLQLTYWRPPVRADKVYVSDTAEVSWTKVGNGGGEYIFGAYITNYLGDSLLWAQAFDEPVTILYDGDKVSYRPQLACGSLALAKGEV
jgi:hypothetical protein